MNAVPEQVDVRWFNRAWAVGVAAKHAPVLARPRLLRARTPRYESLAKRYGYTTSTRELSGVRDEADFLELLATTIAKAPTG